MSAPVLDPDQIYVAFDRYVCGRVPCAGYTALYTGYTAGGFALYPVPASDVAAWAAADLGPLTCECGTLRA